MFFVGATGQLLTLILTVCLPFVFLISGHQKIEIAQKTANFEPLQEYTANPADTDRHIVFPLAEFCEKKTADNETLTLPPAKIRHKKRGAKWKILYLNTSGNKAPPTISYFTC